MAVIEPSPRRRLGAFALFLLLACSARADQAAAVLEQINHVARALSDGNPADAMTPFDKSLPQYETLRNYFSGLTDAYQLTNEATVTDEQDAENETKLKLQWTMTLTEPSTSLSRQRTGEIQVRLLLKNGKWKIIELSPIDFFNPQQSRARQQAEF
ncbi:MAG: hypothetical protein WB992_15305 [Bryobacteraceae bacterium]